MRRLLEEHAALPCSRLTNQDEDTSEPITIFLNRFDETEQRAVEITCRPPMKPTARGFDTASLGAAMQRRPRQLLPDGDFRLTCASGLIATLDGPSNTI